MRLSWFRRSATACALVFFGCGPGGTSMTVEKVDLTGINQPNKIRGVGFAPDGSLLVSAQYGPGAAGEAFARYDTLKYSFASKTWSVFGPWSRCLGVGPADTTLFCQVVPESGTVVEQHLLRLREGGQVETLSDDPTLPAILQVDKDGNLYAMFENRLSVKLRGASAFVPVTPSIEPSARVFVSQDGSVVHAVDARGLYRSTTPDQFEQVVDFTTLENAKLSALIAGAVSTDGSFYLFQPNKRELWKLPPGGNSLSLVSTVPYGTTLSNVMVDRKNRVYVQVRTTDGSTLERAGSIYEYAGGSDWRLKLNYAGTTSHPAIAPNGSAYVVTLQASGVYSDITRIGD